MSVMVPTCNRPTSSSSARQLSGGRTAQPRARRRRLPADPADEVDLRAAFPGSACALSGRPAGGSIGALQQAAVRAAKGEVVVHWDDDDLYAPERIGKQAAPILRGKAT